ncbi:MAG TPA: head GIN domain-containing protein [Anaerolineales bacterium]|nr:head GIN domain-containing protein [Anaerolineales bacterium]HLO32251.1 head GIN domain-containing protein [Anaerolineales bacterium]
MKKKIFLLVSLFVSTSLVLVSCSLIRGRGLGGGVLGSGNIQTEARDTGAFQAISIEYPGAKIIVQQGNKESVEIQADDNLLPQLSTEVLAGRLTIKSTETNWKTSVNPSKQVKMTITARDLNEIVLSAEVGDLEVNDLQTGTLKLVLSGGAQIKLNGIQVDLLDSDLSGAGDIQVSGIANEIKLILSGLGNFNAADLKSNKAYVELSGMGNAIIRVEKELTATITGAGSINYFGNPRVEQNVNGAGSVKQAE